jgi:hypothetical protein
MRVTEIVLRDVVRRGHAKGRNKHSKTNRSRKKNIYTTLVPETLADHIATEEKRGQQDRASSKRGRRDHEQNRHYQFFQKL